MFSNLCCKVAAIYELLRSLAGRWLATSHFRSGPACLLVALLACLLVAAIRMFAAWRFGSGARLLCFVSPERNEIQIIASEINSLRQVRMIILKRSNYRWEVLKFNKKVAILDGSC